jgi:ubiquinol-cytochrome c reductase subunit 6
MSEVKGTVKAMLLKGQDPKEYLIEVCRPQCTSLQQKLQRCETALKNMTHADPELSCMYPLRDWVTCVDSCVSHSSFRFSPKSTLNWLEMSPASFPDSITMNQKSHSFIN